MDNTDAPLSELCTICHIQPPKYRCPRCSTRTCSLPCTRRHKLWSQCSGVRDPAAYLRRSELATESAFDRDFNFITGIERSLERAEREVEDRGIELARGAGAEGVGSGEAGDAGAGAGRKRKSQGQGLVKGEAGFLRGAEAGAVRVVRAPRGMSRNKENSSRWHPKHKCLSWTVEWISATGEKTLRNCLETCPFAEAYDRVFPPPRQERPNADTTKEEKEGQQEQTSASHEHTDVATASATATESATTGSSGTHPAQLSNSEAAGPSSKPSGKPQDLPVNPHRNLYFYLHRPRTTTKKPVLIPLPPSETLSAVLRERTVLEFPTIYLLPQSPETLLAEDSSPFILEEEYLRTVAPEGADQSAESGEENEIDLSGLPGSTVDLEGVDEKKVLEVLKQDLFESVPETVDR